MNNKSVVKTKSDHPNKAPKTLPLQMSNLSATTPEMQPPCHPVESPTWTNTTTPTTPEENTMTGKETDVDLAGWWAMVEKDAARDRKLSLAAWKKTQLQNKLDNKENRILIACQKQAEARERYDKTRKARDEQIEKAQRMKERFLASHKEGYLLQELDGEEDDQWLYSLTEEDIAKGGCKEMEMDMSEHDDQKDDVPLEMEKEASLTELEVDQRKRKFDKFIMGEFNIVFNEAKKRKLEGDNTQYTWTYPPFLPQVVQTGQPILMEMSPGVYHHHTLRNELRRLV